MVGFGDNQDVAFREFQRCLIQHSGIAYSRDSFNKGRHCLLRPSHVDSDGLRYYLVFKRDWFQTFAKQFAQFSYDHPEESKFGESINKYFLDKAIRMKADYIVFLHPNSTYAIIPFQMFHYAREHELVREQEKTNIYKKSNATGNYSIYNEITYSVPVSQLDNIDNLRELKGLTTLIKSHSNKANGDQVKLRVFD